MKLSFSIRVKAKNRIGRLWVKYDSSLVWQCLKCAINFIEISTAIVRNWLDGENDWRDGSSNAIRWEEVFIVRLKIKEDPRQNNPLLISAVVTSCVILFCFIFTLRYFLDYLIYDIYFFYKHYVEWDSSYTWIFGIVLGTSDCR